MIEFNIRTKVLAMSAGALCAVAGTAGAATTALGCTSSATFSLTAALDAACFDGNDSNTIDSAFSVFGLTGWILADKNDDGTSGDQSIMFTSGVVNDTKSGSWAISSLGSAESVMVNLKAGNGWGSFLVDTTMGTWTSSKDLSHASVYYRAGVPTSPVPLPAAGLMLLAGLGGLGAVRRLKKS